MKLKGINPIEQHIEKIVLVVMAVVLLAVLAMQFLLQPNQVDADGRKIPPQDIFKTLENKATALDAQLKDQNPALPEVTTMNLVERYERAFAQKSLGEDLLSAPLASGVDVGRRLGRELDPQAVTEEKIAPLAVPVTTGVLAGSQWGTLDPYAVQSVPEYAEFVPQQQPYDFASVTIESVFSGRALGDALSTEEGAGIPRRFWQGTGLAIMGFEVERQRLLADGTWSDPEPIVTPPTTPIPTLSMRSDAGLPELTGLVSNAVQASGDIERPAPPPTIAGPDWFPPSERIESEDGDLSEGDLLRRKLQRAEAELERLENADRNTGRDSRNPGGGGNRRGPSPTRDDTNTRSRDRLEQLRDEIRVLRDELRKLGEDAPRAGSRDPGARPQGVQESLLSREEVRLWAHDLGVEPGNQYRYRTRVAVNNPLFRKGPVLDPDDESLQAASKEPFARGAWSDWSESVVVGAEEYFFVTAASPDGGPGGRTATASIELYQMFYGSYRRSTLGLTPGDAVASSVRMPDGLLIVDTAQIDAQEAAKAFVGTVQGSDAVPQALPVGVSAISGRLTIDLGAYVLDVVTRPVQAPDQFGTLRPVGEVLIRDRSGAIVSRTTIGDVSSPAYLLAKSSATEGTSLTLRAPGQPAENPSWSLFPRVEGAP